QPADTLVQPVTGFQVRSVHSMAVMVASLLTGGSVDGWVLPRGFVGQAASWGALGWGADCAVTVLWLWQRVAWSAAGSVAVNSATWLRPSTRLCAPQWVQR